MRIDGAFTMQQASIVQLKSGKELLMTEVRFTDKIRATLGTRYDLFKGRGNRFKLELFEFQKRFILNCKYIPLSLFDINQTRKLNDYLTPSLSREISSLAGKRFEKELIEKIKTMLNSKEELTYENLKEWGKQ